MISILIHRNVFIGICVANGALWAYNRYVDNTIKTRELNEEEKERQQIELLKKKLPQRILDRYGLKKS